MDKGTLKRHLDAGVLCDSGTESHPSIPLDVLLSSCHFWNSDKICNFLSKPWDEVKDRSNDDDIKKLQEELNSKSKDAIPLDKNQKSNWVEVLGGDWEILKLGIGKRVKIKSGDEESESVVTLLRQIRNKHSHPNDMKDEHKIAIGWFSNGELDNSAFVTYWAQKFPKLIPFVWLNLYTSVIYSKLNNYYSCLLEPTHIKYMSHLKLDMDICVQLLRDSLSDHLEKGGLVERFCIRDLVGPQILEFRTLPYDAIQTVLDGKSSVIMHVKHDRVNLTWYKIDPTSNKFNINAKLEYTLQKTSPFGKQTTLIFMNTAKDKFLIEECMNSSHVIILFSENAVHESIVAKDVFNINGVTLIPHPLKWMELSERAKLRLEEGEVNFQSKTTKIKDILPHNESEAFFLKLQGNAFINALLVEAKPIIFGKHVLPTLASTYYINRQMFRTCMVTSKVLRHREPDVFIVTNIEPELLGTKVNEDEEIQLIEHLESFMSEKDELTARIYYTFCCDLRNILKILDSNLQKHKYNIHFLRFVEDDLFEWLGTFGSHSIIKTSFAKMADKDYKEEVFLDKIIHEPIEPIFIADKPGMGKSLLLTSLSTKICNTFKKSIVLYFEITAFLEKIPVVKKEKLEKQHIESVIVNTLCSTTFETYVVTFWLQQNKVSSSSIKFELMLDGLDELDKDQRDLALGILKVIHHEFSSIRLWVTLREHMIEELEDHFSVIVYKILPFSENDQISFLKNHWASKQTESIYSSQELFQLAQNCTTSLMTKGIEMEIAGAPLQCRMLAEIYESNLDEVPNGKSIHFPLTKMYEGMIEKKLRECVKEKQSRYISLIRKNMQRNHMYLAIKLLFSDRTSELFGELMGITPEDKEDMESNVKDEGIIQNMKPLIFIHRTFAEYFAALFVFKVLKAEYAKLGLSANNADFQNFFINQVLEVSRSKQQLTQGKFISKFKFPVLCHFLNAMLDNQSMTCPEMKSMMMKAHDFQHNVFESQKSVIIAALQGNYFNMAKLIFESLTEPTINLFMNRKSDMPEFLLEACLRCTDVDFFIYICSTIEAWYKSNHDGDAYKIPENIFKLALGKGKFEMAKFLIETKGFDLNRWVSIRESDKKKYGIVHWIMNDSRHDKDEVLTEKKKLLQYVFDIDQSLVEQTDIEKETPLFMPPCVNVALKIFLITDLHANVNATGKHKNTPFHWKDNTLYKNCLTPEGYHEMLETFLIAEFSQINLINQRGCTPLHCAIKTYKHSLLEKTLELFEKGNADFNIKDSSGSTVLHFCIQNKCSIEFIKKLIDCGSDIYVKNSQGLCALDLARKKKYKALEETLLMYYKAVDIKNMEE